LRGEDCFSSQDDSALCVSNQDLPSSVNKEQIKNDSGEKDRLESMPRRGRNSQPESPTGPTMFFFVKKTKKKTN